MFVIGRVQFQFVARLAFRPQVLAQARRIVGNQGIGGTQYIGGRAIVLFQAMQGRRPEILLETLHIFHAGAAETVNGLIVVAHREQVVVLARQQAQPGILQGIGVLELVHQDMAKALLVMRQ